MQYALLLDKLALDVILIEQGRQPQSHFRQSVTMPINPEHIKECLNYSYVTAVAAKAGATVSQQTPDYGIDATIQYVQQLPNGKYQPTGFALHCQLKATTTSTLEEEEDRL